MASVNKVILVGNLGRDPEVKYMSDGNAICNLSVATTYTWKDKATGEKKDRVDDALHATRAAVEEGIVPGGGIALYNASQIDVEVENEDQEVGVKIVKRACFAPFKAIVENAGKSAEALVANIDSDTWHIVFLWVKPQAIGPPRPRCITSAMKPPPPGAASSSYSPSSISSPRSAIFLPFDFFS